MKSAQAKADQFLGVKRSRPMQIVLLSATITEAVKQLASKSLSDPVAVDVDKVAKPSAAGKGAAGRGAAATAAASLVAATAAAAAKKKWRASDEDGDSDGGGAVGAGGAGAGTLDADAVAADADGAVAGAGAGAARARPEEHATPKLLTQYFIAVPMKWRLVTLLGLLRRQMASKCVRGAPCGGGVRLGVEAEWVCASRGAL